MVLARVIITIAAMFRMLHPNETMYSSPTIRGLTDLIVCVIMRNHCYLKTARFFVNAQYFMVSYSNR